MAIKKTTTKKVVKKVSKAVGVSKAKKSLPEQNKHKVQFKVYAPEAKEVILTGEFNKWNPIKKRMKKNEKGEWLTRAILSEGEYQYKFIINGEWKNDPGAVKFVDNGMGSTNSVKVV